MQLLIVLASLAFTNVRVFDGERVLPKTTVVVDDGRIVRIGGPVPEGAEVIDGSGKTLLPGLIDAHTHAYGNALEQALVFGVTTELDMMGNPTWAADVKRQQAAGKRMNEADLRAAGNAVTAPGGHGTEYGFPVPTLKSPDEAAAFVKARVDEGSDYIKIVYDDGEALGLHFPTISKESLAASIAAAHANHKLAVIHIGSLAGARDAIAAGADALVHLFVDRAPEAGFGRFVAQHHAFVVPTLSVLQSTCGRAAGADLAADPKLAELLAPMVVANLHASFHVPGATDCEIPKQTIAQLRAAKVPILAGTDAPNPGTAHGVSLHGELALLVAAGLKPTEALTAATSAPARAFGLDDRGRIAPGLRADLVLVDGDPTADIRATRRIIGVWKQGHAAPIDAWRAARAKEWTAWIARRNAPPPKGSESGLVSDFADGKLSARFGSWSPSTDRIAGGSSTVELKVADGALQVSGTVVKGKSMFAWAGAMFSPGAQPLAPANLSAKKALVFRARGDGARYAIGLFTRSGGRIPAIHPFSAGNTWTEVRVPLVEFNGSDGADIEGVVFMREQPGSFAFAIDDVRFE